MDINEIRRQRTADVTSMREISDGAAGRDLNAEERASYDELRSKVAAADAQIKRAEELEQLGVSLRSQPGTVPQAPAYIKRATPDTPEGIFCRYIRSGDAGAQRELRASNDTTMNITTAADGGDLVPIGHFNQIIAQLRPQSLPDLLGVRRIPGMGTTVNVPIDNEGDSGAFVSTNESGAFDRDAPAVSKLAMTLIKYTKKVDLTYELMQDEDSSLMAFLSTYVAQGMAATLNTLLITEALANGTAALTLDSASAIGATEIPELLYKLPAEYARGANVAWLMERATEGYLRGLASSSVFTFAPHPGGVPSVSGQGTLFGLPVYTDAAMGSLAASGKSMLIGNWAYMGMRLDPAMTFLLDPYSRAGYGETILHYYFRADFAVLQALAFAYATHPTA